MSEKFNFKRFWTYFKFDLKQMWRNHSKAAILIGGSAVIVYVIWVLMSLVFNQTWSAPIIGVRLGIFILASMILEFYQTRTYGYITEKKAGSSWLMIPASGAEKFVSMLIITLLVIPVLFMLVFFSTDSLLSLLDPTYGQALIAGFSDKLYDFINSLSSDESPIVFTPGNMAFPTIVGFFCNYIYFLLCGVCFRRNKIMWSIAILLGFSILLSILTGLGMIPAINNLETMDFDEDQIIRWTVGLMNAMVVLECIMTVGLGWGVYRRIKTIQQ